MIATHRLVVLAPCTATTSTGQLLLDHMDHTHNKCENVMHLQKIDSQQLSLIFRVYIGETDHTNLSASTSPYFASRSAS